MASSSCRSLASNTTAEVADATLALLAQNVDAVCQGGSTQTTAAFASIALPAQRAKMPVFGFLTSDFDQGATAVIARDYFDAGQQVAGLAARIMHGESPSGIPFQPIRKTRTLVNLALARAAGLSIPPAVIARADVVKGRGASGDHEGTPRRGPQASRERPARRLRGRSSRARARGDDPRRGPPRPPRPGRGLVPELGGHPYPAQVLPAARAHPWRADHLPAVGGRANRSRARGTDDAPSLGASRARNRRAGGGEPPAPGPPGCRPGPRRGPPGAAP